MQLREIRNTKTLSLMEILVVLNTSCQNILELLTDSISMSSVLIHLFGLDGMHIFSFPFFIHQFQEDE